MKEQDISQVLVTNVMALTDDVTSFQFKGHKGFQLSYEAGQFITLILPQPDGDVRRSYSLSSFPGEEPAITVKRIPNGLVSRQLTDRIKAGDILDVLPAKGFFTLPRDINRFHHLIFFAAGVGITPIFSLIKAVLYSQTEIHIALFYSNRSVIDTLFYTELEQLKALHSGRFTIVYLFSNAPNLSLARLNKELLPVLLREHIKADINKTLFYVCGPFPYMRMVMLALEEANIPAYNIKKENFNTDVITRIAAPPDIDAHTVHIMQNNGETSFSSQYPDTILKSAKKQGIELPYSCENGICGSCAALCVTGHVWHRNNEVLTEDELTKGLILTCVGYPVGGDITLNFTL